MNKIVELKIEETKFVVGGVKAGLPVATGIPRERPVMGSQQSLAAAAILAG
jgi:hypothetical protein